MKAVYSFAAVVILAALAYVGGSAGALRPLFGIWLPYAAILTFLAGVSYRVIRWSGSPVPFRIPTSCGQQKSLGWIKSGWLENPHTTLGVVARMALEILLFRSLFRNNKVEMRDGPRVVFVESKFLWLGALAFHWSFLIILVRHLRFFLEPVPPLVASLGNLDAFFQVATPVLYLTDVIILAALTYLLVRRLVNPQVHYISLFTDYFALFLLLGLASSGVLMRYFTRADIVAVKQLAIGLVTLQPVVPATVGALFFVHLFFLSVLLAYFPFSKLMHMGGVFLSPTRNLANNNRAKRHVNPWNYPVKVHTYQEWEDEFHDKIVAAGLPLDRE
jgi:[DsrC]-trisulfide reductase subunit M